MAEMTFKERVAQSVEHRTVDRLVNATNNDDKLNEDFILSLFEVEDAYTLTNSIKEKLSLEEANALAEQEENAAYSDCEDEEVFTESKEVAQAQVKEIVSAEEIKPEIVELIKDELMAQLQEHKKEVINEFMAGKAASQEEFYKIQLWSYFPVIGIPVYLFFLLVLSVNKRHKYNASMQNFAKAQLKTFWIYLVAHASVLFVAAASMTSLINIIQRGLVS